MRIGWCKGRGKDQRRERWAELGRGAKQAWVTMTVQVGTLRGLLSPNGCDFDESFRRLSRNLSVLNGKGNRESMKGRPIRKIVSIDRL